MNLSRMELKTLCENSFLPVMKTALQQVFRAADAAVTRLATDATLNVEQNRYFEAVQALRIIKPELIEHFCQYLLLPLNNDRHQQQSRDVVHINSLRKLLSINIESWRADVSLAAAITDFQQRLALIDTSLPNILSPEHVVDSFLQSLGEAGVDTNIKMLVLRMFEVQLYSKLESYVRMANDALIAQGILPDLETQPSAIEASINAFVDEALGNDVKEDTGEEISIIDRALAELQANDFENIENMLGLQGFQGITSQPATRNLIKELQQQKLLPVNIGRKMQLQVDKIELVGQLFQYIMDDNNLPLEARKLLCQLQVPYARIALNNAMLLHNNKHPARALLNEMIHVCAEWHPDQDRLQNDELFIKLSTTVQWFLEAERVENINYQELLFEYLAFGEGQRQHHQKTTQRLLDSQLGVDVADAVREAVNKILQKKIGNNKLPGAVKRIFDEGWSHVLYMTALQHGLAAIEWKEAVTVADDLLASVQAPDTFVSRSAFILQLPPLLKALREGLLSINLSTTLINQLLSDLQEEHKKIVRDIKGDFTDLEAVSVYKSQLEGLKKTGEETRKEKNRYTVRSSIVFTSEQLRELAVEAVAVVKANAKNVFSEKTQKTMQQIGPGISLLWNSGNGVVRCRIAAYIKHAKKFIITDRAGAKLAELSEFDIAQKLDSGEIETMVSEQLFDRALESVIGNMRDRR